MTRRERLERRLELRREWVEKRAAKAAAAFNAAHKAVEHIPFGQPILVGHHSERHHRADLARHDSAMRRGCESSDMTSHHEAKADGIERQLDRSIFSDDDDATEQLQAKIDKAERLQTAMRETNKIVRNKKLTQEQKIAAIQAIGLSEKYAHRALTPDYMGRIGLPAYALTNNNANIRRMKERIATIATLNSRKAAAEAAPDGVTIEGGEWVRVTFAEKPDRDTLNALKAAGFRWGQRSWTGKRENLPECVQPQEVS